MNANDVIESYVHDVAMRLPRRQRNDVAFELRALLNEELQARAESAGRGADASMATEFLRAFGRPADVATRYRPAPNLIDPADAHVFLRVALIGLAAIWGLGLLLHLREPVASAGDALRLLGHWWGGTVASSLWWLGLLVAGFGVAAWVRRRWPRTAEWSPREPGRVQGGRVALALGLAGALFGLFVLLEPRWVLDVFWGGRAAPAAYDALTYTEAFRGRQGPVLLALIALDTLLLAVALVQGRWSATLRRIGIASSLVMCAAMAWTVLDGPVFMAAASDRMVKFFLVLIAAVTLIDMGVKLYRGVRPAPN